MGLDPAAKTAPPKKKPGAKIYVVPPGLAEK